MTVVINDAALNAFLLDPAGGIARHTGEVVTPQILAISRDYLSRPWPGGRGPFPAPGPPYMRRTNETRLRDSLVVQSVAGPMGIEHYIEPTSIHRGVNYGLLLRDGGGNLTGRYHFMPPEYYIGSS